MSPQPCPACHGARLRPEILAVTLSDDRATDGPRELNIREFCRLTIGEAHAVIGRLELSATQRQIAAEIVREVSTRLGFLVEVGLSYLNLDRESGTLSGGESQRIRLAAQIGSRLAGVLYVLDEPSIGLHQRDNDRLIATLRNLRDLGNSVIVVEHDEDTIRAADHILDIGPGAGPRGGRLVAQGTLEEVLRVDNSPTAQYLTGRLTIAVPAPPPPAADPAAEADRRGKARVPAGEAEHGLAGDRRRDREQPAKRPRRVSARLPDVRDRRQRQRQEHARGRHPAPRAGPAALPRQGRARQARAHRGRGADRPRHRHRPESHRTQPALQPGDVHRRVRADPRIVRATARRARARVRRGAVFVQRASGGRCEHCEGDGVMKIEMQFMPDVHVTCEVCEGRRYNRETLEVTFKGKNIADVLDLTVEEANRFFRAVPALADRLGAMEDVGLGYLRLGQGANTLSGGEAQRVKLAAELAKKSTGRTVYLFDEPTTGLHFVDIAKLMEVFFKLRDAGNTLIVIEHNLEVIKCADWMIDLGPEGGAGGGRIIGAGTPEEIARLPESHTGRYLAGKL